MNPLYFTINDQIRTVAHLYKHLPYHNVAHVREMLENLFLIFGDQLNDFEIIMLFTTILYHDADYRPGYKDNEARAARIATETMSSSFEQLNKLGNIDDLKKTIHTLIISTRVGFDFETIGDPHLKELAKIVHDLDYLNFIKPFNEFYFKNMMIMEEYRMHGALDKDIKEGMIKFMSDVVDKKGVFMTYRMINMNTVAQVNASKLIHEIKLMPE